MQEIPVSRNAHGYVFASARLLRPRMSQAAFQQDRFAERFMATPLAPGLRGEPPPLAAWRARRPSYGVHANLPVVSNKAPSDALAQEARKAQGKGYLKRAELYGAFNRELFLLGGVILVQVAWTTVLPMGELGVKSREGARTRWKQLARHGICLETRKQHGRAPARYQAAALSNAANLSTTEEGENDISLHQMMSASGEALNWDRNLTPAAANRTANRGAIQCVMAVGQNSAAAPEFHPVRRRLEQVDSVHEAYSAMGVELPDNAITPHSMQEIARALAHVWAHESLITQARTLVNMHAGSIVDASEWSAKQNAAGRFLMNWQQFITHFQMAWQLGNGDPFAEPGLVDAISNGFRTEETWQTSLQTIQALASLSAEVLPDGDIGNLL